MSIKTLEILGDSFELSINSAQKARKAGRDSDADYFASRATETMQRIATLEIELSNIEKGIGDDLECF